MRLDLSLLRRARPTDLARLARAIGATISGDHGAQVRAVECRIDELRMGDDARAFGASPCCAAVCAVVERPGGFSFACSRCGAPRVRMSFLRTQQGGACRR